MDSSNNIPPPRDDVNVDREDIPTTRRVSPVLLGLLATVAVLLGLIFLVGRHGGNGPDDRLSDNQLATSSSGEDADSCAASATAEQVKRELFQRAAEIRGNSQEAYGRLAGFAFLRLESPLLTADGACSASAVLELPPGVAASGGRRSLTGEIDYTVQGNAVTLTAADTIATPLSTLTRTANAVAPAPLPMAPVGNDALAPADPPPAAPPAPQPTPVESTANPSFNCGNARTFGEVAACSDPGIASLDRQMASQFNSALADAGPQERANLEQTRSRFLRFRDGCRSNDCVADAYRGRMREIRDIMSGDWRPQR
jgi:hypothetical protein